MVDASEGEREWPSPTNTDGMCRSRSVEFGVFVVVCIFLFRFGVKVALGERESIEAIVVETIRSNEMHFTSLHFTCMVVPSCVVEYAASFL